jgi:hypothetical protein
VNTAKFLFLYVVLPAAMEALSVPTSPKRPIGVLDPGESTILSGKRRKIGVYSKSIGVLRSTSIGSRTSNGPGTSSVIILPFFFAYGHPHA